MSFSDRVSKLFGKRDGDTNFTSRRTSTCEVPVFMSPSRDDLGQSNTIRRTEGFYGEITDRLDQNGRRLTIPASSVYSQSPGRDHQTQFMEHIDEESTVGTSEPEHVVYRPSANSETHLVTDRRRKRRRVTESTKQKIHGKKVLSVVFGVTLFGTALTCMLMDS